MFGELYHKGKALPGVLRRIYPYCGSYGSLHICFCIKDAPVRVNYPEALGLRHLAFKVKSVDDTVKELNAKGIATEPVRLDDYTGKKMTFFHDPDNLPLEIHE